MRAADAAADADQHSAEPTASSVSDVAATPTPAPAPTPSPTPTPTPIQPPCAGASSTAATTPSGPKIYRMGCGRAARHRSGSRGSLDLCCVICFQTNAIEHAECCGLSLEPAESTKLKFGAGEGTDQAVIEVANKASARSAAAENSVAGLEARAAGVEAASADDYARREEAPVRDAAAEQILRHKIIEIGTKQRDARGAVLNHKFSHSQAQTLVILRMCGAQVAGKRCTVGCGLTGYELFAALLL